MSTVIRVPEILAKRARELGVDLESLAVDLLLRELGLDPGSDPRPHIELAEEFLTRAREHIARDPVQAAEKLYKAAEEAVKALAVEYNLTDILSKVEERGRWRAEDLFQAVAELSKRLGDEIRRCWHTAWTLHVWDFHEAKATRDHVEASAKDIELLVRLAKEASSH